MRDSYKDPAEYVADLLEEIDAKRNVTRMHPAAARVVQSFRTEFPDATYDELLDVLRERLRE